MSKKAVKLLKSTVDGARPKAKEYFIWDSEVSGLGLRVHPTGTKVFVFRYSIGRRERRITIGPALVIKVGWARDRAREHAVAVLQGRDPLAEREARDAELTVKDLIERFDAVHISLVVKDSTAREYRRAIKNYILPALGTKKVSAVSQADVANMFYGMRDKRTQANRTLELVSKIFNFAEECGLRQPNTNPRKGIRKNPEKKRERFLSSAEILRIGEVLIEMENERVEMPSAIAATRLLMLTGCRLNEIMTLRWKDLHLRSGFLRLPDSKTGAKDVPIGKPVVNLLERIPRLENNPWVITGRIEGQRLTDLQPFWQRVRARAGLNDVRIHDLRHTFASVAAAAGKPLLVIGKVLGHKTTQSTARYAHLAIETARDAADAVATSIAQHMMGAPIAPLSDCGD